jgi:hypothetical protein
VRIRIIRKPSGSVNGLDLGRYRQGSIYDMDPVLAEYLVMEGFAALEMRRAQRSHRYRTTDRRRH